MLGYDDFERASRLYPQEDDLIDDMGAISKKVESQIQAEWYKNRGNYFCEIKEYKSAIHAYTLAIEKDPNNPSLVKL